LLIGSLRQIGILCALVTVSALAQGSSQDVQQLKAKLQQAEERIQQLTEITHQLRNEITALEQAQKARASPAPAPSHQANVLPPPLPLTYIGNETRTRQTSQDFPEEAPRIDNEELDPTLKGYFRLPGTQTLVRLRGFVKTDLFYDTSFAGLWYGGMVPSSFPDHPQPDSRNSTVSIRPSRFVVEFRQPLGNDTLKGFIDWDIYGTFGRNTPNVRSFWGQYKNFLGGQTWSAFGDPDAFPDTLDFHGPPGMMGLRTPQFRYTHPLNEHHWVGGTVEKSGTDVPFSTLYGTPVPTSTRPDFVGFYRYENQYGHIHAAAILRSVGGFVPNTTIPDLKAHRTGYGASLSGAWRFGRLRDNIVFQGIGGRGIANYYNDNYGLGADVGFDARGRLVATPTWSASTGYQHYWTGKIRSTASYGYLRINRTAGDPDISYHVSNYATGNIIVQPSVLYLFGAEYIYASLRRKDDFEWIGRRIQLSLQFFFNRYPTE
jgi:DcaP outer membrane protein